MRKLGTSFHVRGSARATIVQTCARCLARAPRTVEPEFQMLYQEAGGTSARMERDVRTRDLGVSFFEGNDIDLGPEIRQAVMLALPLKPLCRDDCKGLCPKCGANLNAGACQCARDERASTGSTMEDLVKKWRGRSAR